MSKAKRAQDIIRAMSALGGDIEQADALDGLMAADLTQACGAIMDAITTFGGDPTDEEAEKVIRGLKYAHTWVSVAAKELKRRGD